MLKLHLRRRRRFFFFACCCFFNYICVSCLGQRRTECRAHCFECRQKKTTWMNGSKIRKIISHAWLLYSTALLLLLLFFCICIFLFVCSLHHLHWTTTAITHMYTFFASVSFHIFFVFLYIYVFFQYYFTAFVSACSRLCLCVCARVFIGDHNLYFCSILRQKSQQHFFWFISLDSLMACIFYMILIYTCIKCTKHENYGWSANAAHIVRNGLRRNFFKICVKKTDFVEEVSKYIVVSRRARTLILIAMLMMWWLWLYMRVFYVKPPPPAPAAAVAATAASVIYYYKSRMQGQCLRWREMSEKILKYTYK